MLEYKFTVIGSRPKGLFSNFLHTLQHLYISELQGRIPIVEWNNMSWYQEKNGNVWEFYFEPVSSYSVNDLDAKQCDIKKVYKYKRKGKNIKGWDIRCWDFKSRPPKVCLNNPDKECRHFVNSIINKYVRIKSHILEKVNDFYQNNMEGHHVMGVHIRACKGSEDVLFDIPINNYIKHISEYLDKYNNAKIFIATDYSPYLQLLKEKFRDKVLHCDFARSKNGFLSISGCSPPSENKSVGAIAGEEVLIDAILLSKSNMLIHGASNVSAVAMYFNKKLEHKFV